MFQKKKREYDDAEIQAAVNFVLRRLHQICESDIERIESGKLRLDEAMRRGRLIFTALEPEEETE